MRGELVENNMTNDYFSTEFRSRILLSCKRSLKVSEFNENNITNAYF